jgi:hypothetical protein
METVGYIIGTVIGIMLVAGYVVRLYTRDRFS